MVENINFVINTYDPNQVNNSTGILEFVLCNECKYIFNNPVECTGCQNTYCTSCLRSEESNGSIVQKCPALCLNPTFNNSIFVLKLLSKIDFKCLRGCSNIIKYKDYLNHVNTCLGILVSCPTCSSLVKMDKIQENEANLNEIKCLKEKEKDLYTKIEKLEELNTLFTSDIKKFKEKEETLYQSFKELELSSELQINNFLTIIKELNKKIESMEASMNKNEVEVTVLNNISQEKEESNRKIKYFISCISNVKSYKLNFEVDKNIKEFSEALKNNKSLKELVLKNGIFLATKDAEYLSEALKYNKNITTLNIYGDITVNAAIYISEILKISENITRLDLDSLSVKSAELFSESIRINKKITMLYLKGSIEAESISRVLKSCNNIVNLYLEYLNEAPAKFIGEALAVNKSIVMIYINENIEVKAAQFISEGLAHNKNISMLYLRGNINDESAYYFNIALKAKVNIKELVLDNIGGAAAESIMESLKANVTIDSLYLKNNASEFAGYYIGQALRQNIGIKTLYLSGNLNDIAANAIAQSLKFNKGIIRLDLQNISDKAIECISNALETNRTISYVVIDKISSKSVNILKDILKNNENIALVNL